MPVGARKGAEKKNTTEKERRGAGGLAPHFWRKAGRRLYVRAGLDALFGRRIVVAAADADGSSGSPIAATRGRRRPSVAVATTSASGDCAP